MRSLLIATAALLSVSGCRDPEASPADNGQANVSNASGAHDTNAAASTSPPSTRVSSDEAKRVMHERHEGMEAIGKANKAIKRELDGGSPDLALVRTNAGKINELAQRAAHWFPAGTGPDVGKTGAKAEIWQKPQDFGGKLGAFQKSAQEFNAAAAGNDPSAVKAAFGKLTQACKTCHDTYRSEMKH